MFNRIAKELFHAVCRSLSGVRGLVGCRRQLLPILLVFLICSADRSKPVCGEQTTPSNQPNIVLILADDLGWADLGCYGADLHETPNIDRLARLGVRFTNAYAASPVCSPTRASIMTGKHPARLHRTTWYGDAVDPSVNREKNPKLIVPHSEHNLPHEEVTVAEVLKGAGYATVHLGKWHLGDPEHYPQTQGFDVNVGGTFSGCPASFFHPFIDADGNPMPNLQTGAEGEYLTDRLTDEALTILDQQRSRPFFLSLNYYSVHTPIEGKPELVERYRQDVTPGLLHQNPTYAAMVHSLDESVGRILEKLDTLDIADQTAVILFSDNGGAHYHYQYKNQTITNNSPLREGKGTLYEGGTRVPLIVRWPGISQAETVCREPVTSTDLYPTILDIASLPGDPEHNATVDGRSLVPLLKEPAGTLERDALYWHFPHYYYGMNRPVSSICAGDWKLMEYLEDGRVELYDLEDDLGEKKDLAAELPAKADELRRQLHAWRRWIDAPMPKRVLWRIGKADGATAEFALGPGGYGRYDDDGLFVVGQSDPVYDWPYVHPGPDDAWAGGREHVFAVHFGLKHPPVDPVRLVIDLADTHSFNPPHLTARVNGKPLLQHETPSGGSDASIRGEPAKGKPHQLSVEIAAEMLRAGDNQIEIVNEAGSWVLYDALWMATSPGAQLADVTPETGALVRPRPEPRRTPLERVIVVFKTHFDIGYTDMAGKVVQQYRTSMIDRATGLIEENRTQPPREQFVWTLPGWPMTQALWEGQTPQRLRTVEQAIRDGQLVVHALPFTTHTETLGLEDLVRGLGFSSRLSRRFGLELPRDAKMTDVPCHSWVIPTLLGHAGIEFMQIGCNDASMPPSVPLLFWWEGPDGSRVLTMLTNTYGTWPLPPNDWPHKTWLALIHTYDNMGPPKPGQVRDVIGRIRREAPDAEVTIGRMSDFSDALLAEDPEIPVVSGDMPDTWIHGPMSAPVGCKTARNCRPRIAAAEALDTLLGVWDVDAMDAAGPIAEAYEKSLLYGEHTWGLATQRYVKLVYGQEWKAKLAAGLDQNHRLLEQSWDEHEAYIDRAGELVEPLLAGHLGCLAQNVPVRGPRIVVFNPLPWRRDGIVVVHTQSVDFKALSPLDGERVEPAVVDGKSLRFLARNVPAMGYRTFVPADVPAEISGTSADLATATIESPFFRAVLDSKRGVIRDLVDKRIGRRLVNSFGPHGFGQYLYERHDRRQNADWLKAYVHASWHRSHADAVCKNTIPDVPYAATSPSNTTLRVERDALGVSAVMSSPATETLPHDVSIRLTLYRDLPFADLEVSLVKPPDPWPESGWICLPANIEQPRFRLGRLAAVVDPTKDIVEGSNFHLLWLNSGMIVTDPEGRGLGICPIDSPLVSLGEPGILRYSRRYEPKHARTYVNLFNNHYNTNFRSWWGGKWTSRVRLWSVQSEDTWRCLIAPSWEARSPMLGAFADGPPGSLPSEQAGLQLSRKGVLVTAFGANPDGRGVILRLWEQAGGDGPCEVRLPQGLNPAFVRACDLRGRALGEPIPVHDGQFQVPVTHYAPTTLLIVGGP